MVDEWTFAAGTVDITPRQPVPLASYRQLRKENYDSVVDALEVNAVVLEDGHGTLAVLVALDLLYVGPCISERVASALSDRIPRERIFLAASHTHFAPATDPSLPALGPVVPEYLEFVCARVVEMLERLLVSPRIPVTCLYQEGQAAHSVNRRVTRFGVSRHYPFVGFHTEIRPNERGPRDDEVRVVKVRDAGGRIAAVCWGFACHPNTFPELDCVSAEYPGRVRRRLRERFGAIPVIFWQGFSGDVNPYRAVGAQQAPQARLPRFVPPTRVEWEDWADSLAERVCALVDGSDRPIGGPITGERRAMPLTELGLRSEKRLTRQTIYLGDNLAIVGMSAEVASGYLDRMRRRLEATDVIPVGCTDEVFGYLPVDEMIPYGGYEVRGFLRRFGLRGRFRRDVATVVERRLFPPDGRASS